MTFKKNIMTTWGKTQKSKWRRKAKKLQDIDKFVQILNPYLHQEVYCLQKKGSLERFLDWINLNEDYKREPLAGNFFGALMQIGDAPYEKASKEMNLPLELVHVYSMIFRFLPYEDVRYFPVKAIEATPTNIHTRPVMERFIKRIWHYHDNPVDYPEDYFPSTFSPWGEMAPPCFGFGFCEGGYCDTVPSNFVFRVFASQRDSSNIGKYAVKIKNVLFEELKRVD